MVEEAYARGDVATLRDMARDMNIKGHDHLSGKTLHARLLRQKWEAYLGYTFFWAAIGLFMPGLMLGPKMGAVAGGLRKMIINGDTGRVYVNDLPIVVMAAPPRP